MSHLITCLISGQLEELACGSQNLKLSKRPSCSLSSSSGIWFAATQSMYKQNENRDDLST